MTERKKKKLVSFREVLNGKIFYDDWFLRNWILLLMIFGMLITVISVKYKSERVIREMTALEDSLIDMRSRSISIAAEVMKLSRQSVIIDRVKKSGLDLETSKEPPRKIYVDKE